MSGGSEVKVIKTISKWLLRRLFANPKIRELFKQELAKTHPLLSSKQLKFAPPGHYYSPLPEVYILDQRSHDLYAPSNGTDGISLNSAGQLRLLNELSPFAAQFDWSTGKTAERRFWLNNGFYEDGDALILFSMIRRFRPQRIVEIGSGFSSALMLDINELYCNSQMHLTFVEPNPDRLTRLLRPQDERTTSLIASPVQHISRDLFDSLTANDILFIDSSHVSKLGSDVNYLMFSVLPRLRPGVLIHFHDIFYPFEYPAEWIREGRAWNELYLLRAFLQYNPVFQIVFFNSYINYRYTDEVRRQMPLISINSGSAIWLSKEQSIA